MSLEKTPTLSFNKATGCYEGYVLVQVDAEIFRRMLLKVVEEDESADFTDPRTWIAAIERVGKVTSWLDRPHVKVTPVASMLPQVVEHPVKHPDPSRPLMKLQQPTLAQIMEARLRESARKVPPYKWDECCLTPVAPPGTVTQKERADIGRLRYDERKILKRLYEEWSRGEFILDAQATEQEKHYQQSQQAHLTEKVEAVAEAVNGNGFR